VRSDEQQAIYILSLLTSLVNYDVAAEQVLSFFQERSKQYKQSRNGLEQQNVTVVKRQKKWI